MAQSPDVRLVTESKLLGALTPGGWIADAIAAAVGNAGGGNGNSGNGWTFVQAIPLSTWVIPHLFGRPPNVTVYVAGELVDADVTATDQLVSVSFPSPAVGRVSLS